jgi:integrase
LCLNTRGKAWTANGLSVQLDKLFDQCRERGLMSPSGSLHGLRHSIGAELRGAGKDKEWRKLILGHETDDIAGHYTSSADVTGQLIDMANVIQKRPKRERRSSSTAKKVVKPLTASFTNPPETLGFWGIVQR